MTKDVGVVETWSRFASQAIFEDLPGAIVAKAKLHILDTLGVALAGSTSREAIAATAVHTRFGAGGPCGVWGRDVGLSPTSAAWANGVASHAFELDDTGGCDHSGAVVLPAALAALAVAQGKVSGRELILAVVLGYEFARRALEACGGYHPHNGAGWHSTGTCGTFGAAVASARILGRSPVEMASAIGLSASFSGGTWAFVQDAAHSKRLHAGRAAEGGVMSALLAMEGLKGPQGVLDDIWGGFLNTFALATADRTALCVGMGDVWRLGRVSIKPYASCRGTHSGIDCVGHIIDRDGIRMMDVAEIRLHCSTFLDEMCGGRDISSLAGAQMSLPLAVALRFVWGACDLRSYEDAQLRAPEVTAMLAKIRMVPDKVLPHSENPFVEIVDTDGRIHSHQVFDPKGSPTNPLSDSELRGKFRGLARRALCQDATETLMMTVDVLEQLEDASVILPLLAGDPNTFRRLGA
ncbi:MmgE/PrpD family protein (plasmid) [Bosea vestrisii]|uniref:MmgE/PrpD family protein n=1 Tax=Bosea vestrisii TaxID=151416 RepID=UPI0024E00FEE|nr:MmgE/PrpD family protein [Bosea vestrisii]WID99666.1 MmgE/PrpD family protein [Bosea vestrisii]